MLVLTLLVTSSLVAVLLLIDGARRHRESTERQLVSTARALSLAVDGEVGRALTLLRALAASDELETSDWAGFDRAARAALPSEAAWILVVDEQGRQRINTSMPFGASLPSAAARDFPARWSRLTSRGQSVSGLSRGRVFPGHIVVVDHLAVTATGQRYDLAVVMRAEVLGQLVARQGLPPGWYGGVIDREGYMIARNVDPGSWVGRRATADMVARITTQNQGVFESVSLDGRPTLAGFNRSDLTGWTVSVAMPRAEGGGYLNRSLMLFVAASLGLILLGALLSIWLVRGTTRAVDALVSAAEGLGSGSPKAPASTGISETDQIALALHEAGVRLAAREAELRGLNETLEARVEEQASKLLQAQKLEAVGRMTGGIAHDFNNLLTAVLGNLDLLRRRLDGTPNLRFVSNAREAAERGARLTAQMLAFSRRQRLTPEPIDVNRVLEGMQDLLASTLGGSVRVEMNLAPGAPPAMADGTQLELVVLNLALNARDASPTDGKITVTTASRRIDEQPTGPALPEPGDYVTVTVSDLGDGMSQEVQDRVFEPFFTTKQVGRGSGLGLSQALGVVKQLGGGIEIKSAPGEGARITVFLPVAKGALAAAKPPSAVVGVARGVPVLVVDDYAPLRAATRTMLEDLGCTVHDADGGEAALRLIEGGLDVRLAVVDYAMPGMTGVDLAAHLARLKPSMTVILSSGHLDADDAVRAWTGPLLPKPYAVEELARVVAEHAAPAEP